MAKKQSVDPEKGKSTADYYKLNVKAVDELVTANESNSPRVSDKELRRYRSGANRIKLSDGLKAILIKAWFAGVVCYFFYLGLGGFLGSLIDIIFLLGAALGFVTDLITNPVLRFTEKNDGANTRFMMFAQKKKYYTLPLNVLYAFLLIMLTAFTYRLINTALSRLGGVLAVGPVLFGIITTGWDLVLIGCKRTFVSILADARAKADGQRRN